MTQDIPALIATAKAMREQLGDDYPKSGSILDLWFRTADALEAERQRAEAYLSDPDFDQEFVRVKAERDRYHAALVEIRETAERCLSATQGTGGLSA